jgi:hypothetical protein
MRRTGHARARLLSLLLLTLLAGACKRQDSLPADRRIALPAQAAQGTTLYVDSAGLLWIGAPGRLVAVDTAGRPTAEVAIGRDSVPRLLWRSGPRLTIANGQRLDRAEAAGGRATPGWGSTALRATARDPRGRWVLTANRRGGVMGLDTATLRPLWGWAETGGETVAMAVSPLADRVYVSVAQAGEAPAAVHVRDAGSGRVLMSAEQTDPVRGLVAASDGALYGHADGLVLRLRHGPQGLKRVWAESPPVRGPEGEMELRVDAAGTQVAVFGRGRGARLAVLDAATGRVTGQTQTAPLDAAFGPEGRLYLLEAGSVRVVP